MSDVRQWLEHLGLGRHWEAFAEADVDFDLLPKLTADDLKELGLSLGHRRRFLDAAASLAARGETGAPDVEGAPPDDAPAAGEAERRQLTVMFCDLAGSTELSQRLDPEDLRELNRAYQDACALAIGRYAGFVARYMGDGVLAYFGYPRAHEDDAERAVHAGLAVVGAVRGLDETLGARHGARLAVRIGIATGAVVVGDLIGEGASQESAVVGDTPNLAARLQALAGTQEIVVADATRSLAAGRFEYEAMGSHEVKGFADPVRMWRVVGPSAASSRFEARRGAGITPLVGRGHEIGLLLERWDDAREGRGQVVFLSGEPGIGKSRLGEALRERTAVDHPIRLRYQCSPYHTDSALHPIVEQLDRATRIESDESPRARLAKVRALLAPAGEDDERDVALLAALLSIPFEPEHPVLQMTPEEQKAATLEALARQMETLTRTRPVLLVFEDVHWADATTLELLSILVEQAQGVPVLALVTSRPEFSPAWLGQSHVSPLTLTRLGRQLALEIVDAVAGSKRLPTEIRDLIIDKTDGVPLFVEELTRTVIESDLLEDRGDHYVLTAPLPRLEVPSTLHDSLMARLDRLGPVREVAQVSAVIGREFSRTLLAAVSPLAPADLDAALACLVEAGLLFRRGTPPRLRYVFKHALVRDAAYGSLLKRRRRRLHGQIAEVLAQEFPRIAETEPELLAHHHTVAGNAGAAVEYWLGAGRRATQNAAYVEAVSHLTRGLALIESLPPGREPVAMEIALRVALGVPLMNTQDAGASEVGDNYRRARRLCEELGASEELFPVLWNLWYHHMLRFEIRHAVDLADELIVLGRGLREESLQLEAHHCQWASRFLLGELNVALDQAALGLRLYRPEAHHRLTFTYGGHDPGVCAQDVGALVLWLSGYPESARERMDAALVQAQTLGHPSTLANTTGKALVLSGMCHDFALMARLGERLIEYVPMERAEQFQAHANAALGYASFERGEREAGLSLMREAVRLGLMEDPWNMYLVSLIAKAFAAHDSPAESATLLEEALSLCRRNDVYWWFPELCRVTGELLGSGAPEAETWFERALTAARSQGARSLELRAATSLTRVWHDRGKRDEAREVLTPLYEWFIEGLDTPDLVEAKALLESLG